MKMLPGAGGAAGGGGALGTCARRPGPTSSSAWRCRNGARRRHQLPPQATSTSTPSRRSGHRPRAYAGETQQQHCAATEVEALDLRNTALTLVLSGVAQATTAAAADVALAGSGSFLGRLLAVVALFDGTMNVYSICYVVHGVAVVAARHCAGGYLPNLVSYLLVAMTVCG